MRQALLFSFAAHFALMATIMAAPLFYSNKMIDISKVYKVSLVDLPGGSGNVAAKRAKTAAAKKQGDKPKTAAENKAKAQPQVQKQTKEIKSTKANSPDPKKKVAEKPLKSIAPAKKTQPEQKTAKKPQPEKKPAQTEQKVAKTAEPPKPPAQEPAQNQTARESQAPWQPGILTTAKNAISIGEVPGGGSLSFDSSVFPYPYYIRIMQTKIAENWLYKDIEVLSGQVKKAIVSFRIIRDGTIKNATVEQSSGVGLMDTSALRAIEAASPFPPLPTDFKEDYLNVYIGFEFTNNG